MSEQAPTLDLDERETVAVKVAAGGIAALVLGLILGSGLLRALGLVATLAGGGLFAREKLAQRNERIDAAESHIREELEELDAVGRAQVLRGLAEPDDAG